MQSSSDDKNDIGLGTVTDDELSDNEAKWSSESYSIREMPESKIRHVQFKLGHRENQRDETPFPQPVR